MPKLSITDHAILLCQLAEHQGKLDENVDNLTIQYLNAQKFASNKLEELRSAIDLRDAMMKVRTYEGVNRG